MPLSGKAKKLLVIALFLTVALCLDRFFDIQHFLSFFQGKRNEGIIVKRFSFSTPDSLKEWEEKILNKRVIYLIDTSADKSYVHAISNRSCSAMYHEIKLEPGRRPILSWKWRVGKFPDKKSPDDLSDKKEDDFAARIYVIFPAIFFANSKVLEYIWARDLETGTIASSPYSKNIKLIVAESGLDEGGAWAFEERDIYEDYLAAFNAKPNLKVGNIAFMCDSDSTQSDAEAYFDEITISFKE